MLAGDIYAPRKIRLVQVPEPKLADSANDAEGGERIIFQPELACLCSSDLPFFERDYPKFMPNVGQSLHEMIGRVVETNGARFRPGDRVLCVPNLHFGLWERFDVADERAIPLAPNVSDEQAVLAQPLGTVICALKKLPTLVDLDIVVVGQGPMGQLLAAGARNLGAREIIGLDRLDSRLATSLAMGASAVVNVDREDPIAAVERITGGNLADIVIEAVGHRDHALNFCIELCRERGRILFFGLPPPTGIMNGIRWQQLFLKNITVHTSVGPTFTRDFPLAMRWISESRIDVTPIMTHRFKLDEIQTAFDTFYERRDGALKVFVEFPAR